jgi:Zn-dependent peptidase ImmA (M78 family)
MDQIFHIFISSNLDPIKKRMCVAHELAHIDDDTVDGVHVFLAEKRAYKMAREKLIPCKALLEMMSD